MRLGFGLVWFECQMKETHNLVWLCVVSWPVRSQPSFRLLQVTLLTPLILKILIILIKTLIILINLYLNSISSGQAHIFLITTLRLSGKIILFGEHSVVHGTHAIATVIDKRLRVRFSSHDKPAVIFAKLHLSTFLGNIGFRHFRWKIIPSPDVLSNLI